jgi:hypothetical protein
MGDGRQRSIRLSCATAAVNFFIREEIREAVQLLWI